MTKPLISIHDGETDTTIVREMDEIEYAEHLAYIEKVNSDKVERDALALATEKAKIEAIDKLRTLGIDPLAFGLQIKDEAEAK